MLGDDKLYLGRGNKGYKLLTKYYESETDFCRELPISVDGMQGLVLLSKENVDIGG